MNSSTWFVEQDGRRWVAKSVPAHDGRAFAGGLAVAAALDRRGSPAGRPEPTRSGSLHITDDGGEPLALLTFVPGRGLTGRTPKEQRLIGETLGRAHAALDGVQIDGADRFHWVDPAADHLRIRPWLRPAIAGAVAAYEQVGDLSWSLLHADPSPDAFRCGETCGLIDWATALYGPWLYDVASTVMYLGGPAASATFLDGYLRTGPLNEDEVERGLATMLRFRFAVQADYFARRVVRGDLTGIDSAAGNEQGLEDARQGLALSSS